MLLCIVAWTHDRNEIVFMQCIKTQKSTEKKTHTEDGRNIVLCERMD